MAEGVIPNRAAASFKRRFSEGSSRTGNEADLRMIMNAYYHYFSPDVN
jgi:hypothetical protein